MTVFGKLNNFFETGTEGVCQALLRAPIGFEKYSTYDNLVLLEEGNYLEIYDPNALYSHGEHVIIWSGVIKEDRESLKAARPFNSEVEQQNVCGFWVHWLQKGFEDHEQWCKLFVMGYPAKLVKS